MDMRTRTILLWSGVAVLILAGIVTLSLSFRGSKNSAADDLNAVYTNAASTIAAQQQTLQAGALSPTPNVALGLPTSTLTPLPTATFQQQTPVLLPTSALAPSGGPTGCDNAIYVSDVTIPDGTTVEAGKYFTKTWKVSNTGSCTWTATYQLIFISGDSMGGKATAIGKIVKPGESADISVVLTSSSAAGNITGVWRLSNDKAQPFGDSLTVVVNSGTTTGTVAPTPTKTPTPGGVIVVTATHTPTPTPTPTFAAPTETPTPTPTPTPTNVTAP
jgi:hypothetical protein